MNPILHIIEYWKKLVANELLPLITNDKNNDHVERNIYSEAKQVDYQPEFVESQYNICSLSYHTQNAHMLQVGFRYGFSALLALIANPTIHITCVDNEMDKHDDCQCLKYIRERFPERFKLLKANQQNALSDMLQNQNEYDIVHIQNAIHVRYTLNVSCLLCKREGAIVVENIDESNVSEAWESLVATNCLYDMQGALVCPAKYQFVKFNNYTYHEAFYTVFFGIDDNIANRVNEVPSKQHSCFYFTNNQTTFFDACAKGWIAIYVQSLAITDDAVESAMQAKLLKAKPTSNSILQKYEYTMYLDSKLIINADNAFQLLNTYPKDIAYIIKMHPYLPNSVWAEFHESLFQERYVQLQDRMCKYIQEMLSYGFQAENTNLYATGVIIRNMKHPKTKQIDDAWYTHIQKCGIECQISFFFVNQLFSQYIIPDGYGKDYIST